MASTFSNLKFEIIGNGEQSGTWGTTTNTNIGTAIEQAIVGMATLDSGDFSTNVCTLTLSNTNAAQDARALCLNIASGAVSAAGTVNVPAIEKPYIIINGSSYTVTVKVSGQTGVAVPAGKRTVVYNNGTDVGSQINWLAALEAATLTTSGTVILNGGTANGVAYLNGSKVLTTGSALTFDGTNLTAASGGASLRFTGSAGNKFIGQADALITGASSTDFGLQATNNIVFAAGGTSEQMRLTSTGLGIGTSSPGAKLELNDGSSYIRFSPAAEGTIIANGSTGLTLNSSTASTSIRFRVAEDERARIDSSGNLIVNSSTPLGIGKFSVLFAGSTNNGIEAQDSTTTSAAVFIGFRNSAGTLIGGVARVTTTNAVVYNTTSDYRLKTVIGPVADAGQRIDALQPIEYTWNADGSRTRGFLAHQFQEVYAGSVTGAKDAVDTEGKPVYQQMQASTSEVIADLVAEIQSLRARVAALESN